MSNTENAYTAYIRETLLIVVSDAIANARRCAEDDADAEWLSKLEGTLTYLETQPEAPERWEPVEDAEITLPDDLRICRRVEAQP